MIRFKRFSTNSPAAMNVEQDGDLRRVFLRDEAGTELSFQMHAEDAHELGTLLDGTHELYKHKPFPLNDPNEAPSDA